MAQILLFLRYNKIWVTSYLLFDIFTFCDFDQTILVPDRCYFQTRVILTKSIGIILQEIDASVTFCRVLKKFVLFSLFGCLLHFYKMQFQVLYFTFICYQLILIIEFVPKMKYLCLDLMFLSKINQVMLAILLFLDLRSVLQMIFFVTFYFLLFLFDQTILVLDGCYFQTSKIIIKSIGIISQEVDGTITFWEFSEKIVTFPSFI